MGFTLGCVVPATLQLLVGPGGDSRLVGLVFLVPSPGITEVNHAFCVVVSYRRPVVTASAIRLECHQQDYRSISSNKALQVR